MPIFHLNNSVMFPKAARHRTAQQKNTPKRFGRTGPKQTTNGLGESKMVPKEPRNGPGSPTKQSLKGLKGHQKQPLKSSQTSPQTSPQNSHRTFQKWSERAPKHPLKEFQKWPEEPQNSHRNGLGAPNLQKQPKHGLGAPKQHPKPGPEMVWESSKTSPGMVWRAKAPNWLWTGFGQVKTTTFGQKVKNFRSKLRDPNPIQFLQTLNREGSGVHNCLHRV